MEESKAGRSRDMGKTGLSTQVPIPQASQAARVSCGGDTRSVHGTVVSSHSSMGPAAPWG